MQSNIMIYKVYHAAVTECLTELFRLKGIIQCNLRGSKFDIQLPNDS